MMNKIPKRSRSIALDVAYLRITVSKVSSQGRNEIMKLIPSKSFPHIVFIDSFPLQVNVTPATDGVDDI